MKHAVIFDTNILRNLRDTQQIRNLKKQFSDLGTVFVPEIVLDELTSFYQKILDIEIIKNKFLIDTVSTKFDIDEIKNEVQTGIKIRNHISKIFSNEIPWRNNITLEEVYKRSIKKIPPFENDKSDKGLKDTLIWLSILKHDFDSFNEVLFVTKDKSFISQESILSEEFEKECGLKIKFFEDTLQLETYLTDCSFDHKKATLEAKPAKSDISTNSKELVNNYKKMSEYRDRIHQLVLDLIYAYDPNPYSHSQLKRTFTIHTPFEIDTLNDFTNQLNKVIENYILSIDVDPYEIFANCIPKENFVTELNVSTSILVEFVELLDNFINELPSYSSSFLKTITSQINKECLFEKNSNDFLNMSDDLPF